MKQETVQEFQARGGLINKIPFGFSFHDCNNPEIGNCDCGCYGKLARHMHNKNMKNIVTKRIVEFQH
jgi:hypothetical protein